MVYDLTYILYMYMPMGTVWYQTHYQFLALLDLVSRATVGPSSVGTGVRCPSVVHPSSIGSRPNFIGSYLSAISPDRFFFSQIFNIQIFTIFFRFVNMGPYASKNLKMLLLLQFSSAWRQTYMTNKVVMGECKAMDILAICQKLNILGHFEIFGDAEPYGAGNFKTLLLR